MKKITYEACTKCGSKLRPHWLKNGVCLGCRNPENIIKAK